MDKYRLTCYVTTGKNPMYHGVISNRGLNTGLADSSPEEVARRLLPDVSGMQITKLSDPQLRGDDRRMTPQEEQRFLQVLGLGVRNARTTESSN